MTDLVPKGAEKRTWKREWGDTNGCTQTEKAKTS